MADRLRGKRVLVTQAADYMGPATVDVFREQGADVVADDATRTTADASVPAGRAVYMNVAATLREA